MKKILLIGSNDRACLAFTRSLGSSYKIYILRYDIVKTAAEYSKFCYKSIYIGKPEIDFSKFCKSLHKFGKEENFDFYLPMDDIAIEILKYLGNVKIFKNKLILDDLSNVELAINKFKVKEIAKLSGFTIPETVNSKVNFDLSHDEYIFRPFRSVSLQNNFLNKHNVSIIKNIDDYERSLSENQNRINFFLQKKIKGSGVSIGVFSVKGEIFAITLCKRINEPDDGGGSTLRKRS